MNGFNQHSLIYSSQSGPCAQQLPTATRNHATGAAKKLSLKCVSTRRLPGLAGSKAGHCSGSRERCRSPFSHFVQCRYDPPACRIGSSSSIRASTPLPSSSWRQLQRQEAALQRNQCSPCSATSSKEVSPTIASAANSYQTPGARRAANLAVFVSGGGSNLKALHAAIVDGRINGTIVTVVSDKPGCGGWEFAQSNGIAVLQFPSKKHESGEHAVTIEALPATLRDLNIDFICLAGFLKLIPVELVRAFPRRILNIHPSLLPAFGGAGYYGTRVHRAVVATGARYSGATIQFIDEEYDTGPILAQRVVSVYPSDTPQQVAARVLLQEHELYPEAVAALCDDRVTWREDGVPIIWKSH